jgi:hypothetical protein
MYEQRVPEPPATTGRGRLWRPEETPLARQDQPPHESDRYVVVDRIDGDVVTLAVAPWPAIDPATGRLRFDGPGERTVRTVARRPLQARIDRARADLPDTDRPVRVSDVYLVRGMTRGPARWELVFDVTRAGRFAAKAALLATVAPAPATEELETYGFAAAEPVDPRPRAAAEPPDRSSPPGPVAFPSV